MRRPRETGGGEPQVEPRESAGSDFSAAVDALRRSQQTGESPFERNGRNRISGLRVPVAPGVMKRPR